jgi:MSHA pilin protein MshD
MRCNRSSRGFTLIELLVTILVIALSATALMGVFTATVGRSADPMIREQALAIAESYLEEIQLKAFCEDMPACSAETGGSEAGETRADYDDIQDYNALPTPHAPADQTGTLLPELADYRVSVSVQAHALGALAASEAQRIDIRVDHPTIDPVELSVYRTRY